MKITIEPSRNVPGHWSAFLGDKWELGDPIGVGYTPFQALGSLIASAYEALEIKISGPPLAPGDVSGVLGAIVRGNAEHFEVEVEIREGKDDA